MGSLVHGCTHTKSYYQLPINHFIPFLHLKARSNIHLFILCADLPFTLCHCLKHGHSLETSLLCYDGIYFRFPCNLLSELVDINKLLKEFQ